MENDAIRKRGLQIRDQIGKLINEEQLSIISSSEAVRRLEYLASELKKLAELTTDTQTRNELVRCHNIFKSQVDQLRSKS